MALPDATDLDALVALARYGSLSAAAKRRGVAVSTLSRRIDAAEVNLGLKLVTRHARGAQLTEAGQHVAAAAAPLSGQLDRVAQLAAALASGAALRPVRLSATEFIVSDVLAPQLPALLGGPAPIAVELRSEADVISLAARDADIAVRMVRPTGASLVIRKQRPIALSLYTSRAYLGTRAPGALDLAGEALLAYDDSYGALPETTWIAAAGLSQRVVLRSGSTRALLTAALAGAGIALLPDVIASRHTELVALPLGPRIAPRTPYITWHRDLQHDPNVRRVADWATGCFQRLTTFTPLG
ncbi:MAG: LysR family transcriptional regulator [Sphingopyxis sp.]|nr:LysR family transcriptional regulator [Sphingopyxis sp.]